MGAAAIAQWKVYFSTVTVRVAATQGIQVGAAVVGAPQGIDKVVGAASIAWCIAYFSTVAVRVAAIRALSRG